MREHDGWQMAGGGVGRCSLCGEVVSLSKSEVRKQSESIAQIMAYLNLFNGRIIQKKCFAACSLGFHWFAASICLFAKIV